MDEGAVDKEAVGGAVLGQRQSLVSEERKEQRFDNQVFQMHEEYVEREHCCVGRGKDNFRVSTFTVEKRYRNRF